MSLSVDQHKGVPYTKIPQGFELPLDDAYNNHRVHSPNLKYYLVHQFDGNVVLYKSSGARAIWASNTTGGERRVRRFVMQGDGNFVLYWGGPSVSTIASGRNSGLQARWSTNTHGNPAAFLAVQDDGNLVIYSADKTKALWATGTNGR